MPESFEPGPIPKEALAFFRAKRYTTSFDHRDVWREQHATAFTVAKAMQMDVLESIGSELDRALAEGRTFEQFKNELQPTLQKLGWWGKREQTDPLTGDSNEVQLGSPHRLRRIYQTNLRTARAAGQEQRIQRNKATRPFKQYKLGPSEVHREQHEAWNGLILPIDHPFWASHNPPNGFGCKCHVRSLTAKKAQRLGGVSQAPTIEHQDYTNKRTGEVSRVPKGIDPGFDVNPAAIAQRDHAADVFGTKLKTTRADVGAQSMTSASHFVQSGLTNNYRRWVQPLYRHERTHVGEVKIVGVMSPKIVNRLRKLNIEPQTAALTLQDRRVRHFARDAKKARQQSLPENVVLDLAAHLSAPKAILLDKNDNRLLYVFAVGEKLAKVVVDIGRHDTARLEQQRSKIQTNAITTATLVQKNNLTGNRFELLEGHL